jgi:MFS-type transporter involved in bile tolerance (Atg22 family)
MATLFGKSEINLEQGKLIMTLLIIQIEAIIGAIFFSRLSKRIGNKNVISITIILWILLVFLLISSKRKSKCRISILRNCSHHRFGNGRNSVDVSFYLQLDFTKRFYG